MTNLENIAQSVSGLGETVLGYILNLPREKVRAFFKADHSLNTQQYNVLKELISDIEEIEEQAIHRIDQDNFIYFHLSSLTTRESRHKFNYWRESLGGKVLSPLLDDDVTRTLTTLAIETYPALLLSTSERFKDRALGLASLPPYYHPANELFEQAVLKDPVFSKFFSHYNKDTNLTELTPSVWTNMLECRTGSKTRNGQKGSCHEKTEIVQFRVQASSC